MSVFGRIAEHAANDGVPKLGYALAAAQAGDLDRGAWAMRRAFRIDPNAMYYFKPDRLIKGTLQRVAGAYKRRQGTGYSDKDAAFTLAAVQFLLNDEEASRSLAARISDYNDNSASADNLKRLIAAMGDDSNG